MKAADAWEMLDVTMVKDRLVYYILKENRTMMLTKLKVGV